MEWTRAKDWLIGATGTVLMLGVAVMILWWVASEPAGGGAAVPVPPPAIGSERPPGTEPPSDLHQDEVWFADLSLSAGRLVASDSMLRDVRAVGQDVIAGSGGIVAAQVTMDATVPFEVVARELGPGAVVSAADGGQAEVVRTVEALGRELRVTATGTVDVEAGRLVFEPRSVDVGGPDFLADAIGTVVRGLVTIEHDIEGLPEGLVLQDVAVQGDGIRADLRGEDVHLVP